MCRASTKRQDQQLSVSAKFYRKRIGSKTDYRFCKV